MAVTALEPVSPVATLAAPPPTPIWRDRMPELDAVRGVAILAVFAYHACFWSGMGASPHLLERIAARGSRLGWLGVDLFFVLSGFLITGRLVDRRAAGRGYYRWFYLRRALRILPLYYVTLLIVGAILYRAGETDRRFLTLSVVYLPNIAIIAGAAVAYPLAVLWSLGIEEQFYIVWPTIVRQCGTGALALLALAICAAEPVLRYLARSGGDTADAMVYMATWLRLDGFAWGALLSLAVRTRWCSRRRLIAVALTAVLTALIIVVLGASRGWVTRRVPIGAALQLSCADLFFFGAIGLALAMPDGLSGRNPVARSLRYVGAISYCLYLVHEFVLWSFDRLAGSAAALSIRAVIALSVSVAVAELSRRWFEQPLLRLRPMDV